MGSQRANEHEDVTMEKIHAIIYDVVELRSELYCSIGERLRPTIVQATLRSTGSRVDLYGYSDADSAVVQEAQRVWSEVAKGIEDWHRCPTLCPRATMLVI